MKVIASTVGMEREDWLLLRKKGIGGSDAGAICGLNPYRSAIDVWHDKRAEEYPEEKNTEAIRVGHDLEEYVAQRFCEATKKKVRRRNAVMQSEEWPWMIANVDRMVVGENALLECKTANAYGAARWMNEQCPASYEIQCLHYMAVTGAEKVYLACLIMGIDFVIREIPRDEEAIEALVELERRFWQDYVLPGEMPPPSGTDADGEAIRALYPNSTDGETIILDGQRKAIARIDEIDALMEDLQREKDAYKQIMMSAMQNAETAYIGERRITWKTQKGRTTLDTKKLKADMPEIYEKYTKIGKPVRVFRIWDVKEAKGEVR